MEWIMDPAIWMGLFTLIVLEIVLGIDNLVFIAILAEKLPPHQRDKARILGLSLALLMRLILLSVMSHLIKLTKPLFHIGDWGVAGRDIILMTGGFFLLWKATTELHERLEGIQHTGLSKKGHAGFCLVLLQIVVLDAVFSLDSIITAVGMVDHLPVMFAAVIIAMGMMMLASRPLTRFVNNHPTVVMLCLSFLLMIGFSLVAEGLGFKLPKGYLYAAIGFSIMVEVLNQIRLRNQLKHEALLPLRYRTARAILRFLPGRDSEPDEPAESRAASEESGRDTRQEEAFGEEERKMITGVLMLGERSVVSVMTPRADMDWLNVSDSVASLKQEIMAQPHGMYPVCGAAGLDQLLGIGRAKDLLVDLTEHGAIQCEKSLRDPLIVPESVSVVNLIEMLRQSRVHMALVSDEYGTILGLITPMDVLEAIAGEFPDIGESLSVQQVGEGHWIVDGTIDIHSLENALGIEGLSVGSDDYTTLAGLMLDHLQQLPELGQVVKWKNLRFEVLKIQGRRIAEVDVTLLSDEENVLAVNPSADRRD